MKSKKDITKITYGQIRAALKKGRETGIITEAQQSAFDVQIGNIINSLRNEGLLNEGKSNV